MVWGGGWAVGGYGITTVALVLAIANWGLIFALQANAPPVARLPSAEERWQAKVLANREEFEKSRASIGSEPTPPIPVEPPLPPPVPPPPPDPTPQEKVGWGEVFGEGRTPLDALKEVEHWIELRTANLESYRNKDQFNLGVAEFDLKLAQRDLEFLRQLDPERPPPKSFMEAEVKLRELEYKAAVDNHRRRSRTWVQEHVLENKLEESAVQQLERRCRRAEQYLSRWPVP